MYKYYDWVSILPYLPGMQQLSRRANWVQTIECQIWDTCHEWKLWAVARFQSKYVQTGVGLKQMGLCDNTAE